MNGQYKNHHIQCFLPLYLGLYKISTSGEIYALIINDHFLSPKWVISNPKMKPKYHILKQMSNTNSASYS